MARKPTDFGPAIDQEIETRTARGESAETVASALGMSKQVRTIRRRQAELRGRPAGKPAATPPTSPAPSEATAGGGRTSPTEADVPDVIPEGTPLEQLDRWIKRLEQGAAKAEEQGNLSALASIAAKVTALWSLRNRSLPTEKPDPNERPDYIELARQGEERLLQLIRGTFKSHGIESP